MRPNAESPLFVEILDINQKQSQIRCSTYAQASARVGELDTAREVLLETAGHVGFEDPRLHTLMGQVALALHEPELLREAKSFLHFFQLNSWERRLDEIVQSGSPNFEF